jgi:chromosome partitioning protein
MKKIHKFLTERPCLSVNCLEKESGLPPTTLSKFKRNERELNEDHIKKLIPVLKKYGYQE